MSTIAKEKIVEFLQGPQIFALATVTEEGLPWTRTMVGRTDENLVVRIATFANSRKVTQIQKQPEVHLNAGCMSLSGDTGPYLQLQGRAVVRTDAATKEAAWADTLQKYFAGPADSNYAVIEVEVYRVEWNGGESPGPMVWER